MKLPTDVLFTNPLRQDDFFDDFLYLDTTSKWTDTSTDTNAVPALVVDGSWSAVTVMTGDGTTNNEAYLSSKPHFDIVANRPIIVESALKFTEIDTDKAAVVNGLMSGWAANHLVDTTGVLVTSFSGCVFHKTPGTTAWQFSSRVATTSYGSNVIADFVTGAGVVQTFRIEIRILSSSQCEIVPKIGAAVASGKKGVGGTHWTHCLDASSRLPIKHILTYTSFAPAAIGFGIKAAGGTNNAESMQVGLARVSQLKA